MEYSRNRFGRGTVAVAVALALPLRVSADAAYDALKSQVEALQKQLQQVRESLALRMSARYWATCAKASASNNICKTGDRDDPAAEEYISRKHNHVRILHPAE